jgi:predicted RNA-binding protein
MVSSSTSYTRRLQVVFLETKGEEICLTDLNGKKQTISRRTVKLIILSLFTILGDKALSLFLIFGLYFLIPTLTVSFYLHNFSIKKKLLMIILKMIFHFYLQAKCLF